MTGSTARGFGTCQLGKEDSADVISLGFGYGYVVVSSTDLSLDPALTWVRVDNDTITGAAALVDCDGADGHR
jgi:hypothetical protein